MEINLLLPAEQAMQVLGQVIDLGLCVGGIYGALSLASLEAITLSLSCLQSFGYRHASLSGLCMSRHAWSLFAYQLIVPDEQLDLFACREAKVHLVARQLELGGFADRTLCSGLLPAAPLVREIDRGGLRDKRLCQSCRQVLEAQRRGERLVWSGV